MNEGLFEKTRDFAARHALFLPRLSLATVFFWFGVLKVANLSPVASLLRGSIPFLGEIPYLQLLGVAEMVIGAGLLVNRLANQATLLMIFHLLGTMSLFVIAPSLIFAPVFPVLTMDGEFVLKNVVLITSALVICFCVRRTQPDLLRRFLHALVRFARPLELPFSVYERSQCLQIPQIRARIVVRSFQNESGVGQFRMTRDSPQRRAPDVAFADVPVAIHAGIVRRARIVEMDCPHLLQTDKTIDRLQGGLQSVCFANVVTGGEGMRRINAHAELKFGTGIHDCAQMFEAVPDTFTLTRGVLQQNAQRPEFQTFAGKL